MDIPAILISSAERAPWGWALMIAVILASIKVWPIINAQVIAANEQARNREQLNQKDMVHDHRADLTDCKARLDAMDVRLAATEERAHKFEMQLIATLTAYRIVEAETEIERPQSPALVQSRRVLREVFHVVTETPMDMTTVMAKVQQ